MRSEKIELLLKNSKEREKRFKELGAPQAVIDNEKKQQRRLYMAKIIDYKCLFKKWMDRLGY